MNRYPEVVRGLLEFNPVYCLNINENLCHCRASKRPPPDALIRRLESLETPPNPPITVYSKKMDRLKRGMSKEDAQIADRLEKLQRQVTKHFPISKLSRIMLMTIEIELLGH